MQPTRVLSVFSLLCASAFAEPESVVVRTFRASPAHSTLTENRIVTEPDRLRSPGLHVQRLAADETPLEISPQGAYEAQPGFRGDGRGGYQAGCAADEPTACPNAGFDGVSIHYWLTSFRARQLALLASLGAHDARQSLESAELSAFVNVPVLHLNSGTTFVANEAAYLSDCRGFGVDRCLVFLPPAARFGDAVCGMQPVPLYPLSREGTVVVHEYQHFVTETISAVARGENKGRVTVADVLHEGYSDYFGASHITRLEGRPITRVLDYAYQRCPAAVRDVAKTRRFAGAWDGSAQSAGLSWAQGLWRTRAWLGEDDADRLALQSLLYVPARPSFQDAVESVVRADVRLFGGRHATRLRALFYDELGLAGRDTLAHPASDSRGFTSCAAARPARDAGETWPLEPWLVLFGALAALGTARRRRTVS